MKKPFSALLHHLTFGLCLSANLGGLMTDVAAQEAPITPKETIVLFDGKTKKDLSEFYTWLRDFGHKDPNRVFTVVDQIDGAPAIRSSGQNYGGIVTKANYANYKLVTEFRWGNLTWAPRTIRARDSGILLHGQGEDGNAAKDFNSPWFRSVEFQIIEGGTGDIILVNGFDRGADKASGPTLVAKVAENGKNWDPNGKATEFEKPPGEWNRLEAICQGGDVTYFVNGIKVMEGRNGSYKSGKLLFQSEGAEIFFRLIELHPLK
jgi:hypothetical protein